MATPNRPLAPNPAAPTTPAARLTHQTPLDRSVRSGLFYSIRKGNAVAGSRGPLTPHARAALRGRAQLRAAMLTPGRRRRNSGIRERRDSPLGALKSLGKLLAPTSRPIDSSSSSSPDTPQARRRSILGALDYSLRSVFDEIDDDQDDQDDDLLLSRRPRLSLPIEAYDNDDDGDLHPHHSLGLDDDNFTTHSVEAPRRALLGTHQRDSLGSTRLSEFHLANRSDLDLQAAFDDGNVDQVLGTDDGDDDVTDMDGGAYMRVDGTVSRRETLDATRESDFGLHVPIDLQDDETTFVLGLEGQDNDDLGSLQQSPHGTIPSPEDSIIPDVSNDETMDHGSTGSPTQPLDIDYDVDGHQYDDSAIEQQLADNDFDQPAFWQDNDHSGSDNGSNSVLRNTLSTQLSHIEHRKSISFLAPLTSAIRFGTRPTVRISHHGLKYPILPPAFIKKVARTSMRAHGAGSAKLAADTVAALTDVSDWFLQQAGSDLEAYATHARRKVINESDVLLLIKRQVIFSVITWL